MDTESSTPAPHPAPASLGAAGAALWTRLTDRLTFDDHELVVLQRACAMTDRIDALDAAVAADGVMVAGARGTQRVHPGIAETRALALAQQRLFVSLRIPVGYGAGGDAPTGARPQRRGLRGVYNAPLRRSA